MENWMKVLQRYKLLIIRQISARDVMYNIINIINCFMLCMKVVKRGNPKSSHHKEKIFFSFSLILYLYEMMDVH